MLPEDALGAGDWVLIHMGFAVEKTDARRGRGRLAGT